jgi:SAM-dependent methyltransferase
LWHEADESERPLLAVQFCVHYAVPGVLERTGLSAAEPPREVTAMGHASLAAGGSLYYADLVVDFLRGAGIEVAAKQRVLDFGCSSGRVARVLAAVYPTTEWSGCDPDKGAVEWAGARFPGVNFFVSGVEPPLPYPADHLELVYAISIWTHYSEPAALRWLNEIRRVVKVGGHLLLTAHGYRAVEVRDGEWADWPPELIAETATRLYSDGFKFHGGYGKDLSLALSTPDWGESFFTPEWLADHACPEWAILDFAPGRVESHHDVYLLERRT